MATRNVLVLACIQRASIASEGLILGQQSFFLAYNYPSGDSATAQDFDFDEALVMSYFDLRSGLVAFLLLCVEAKERMNVEFSPGCAK